MTLFEVGVSLLIMAVSVTSTLMMLPTGIQVQQATRYRFLAAAKAQNLAAALTSRTANALSNCYFEGSTLVDGVSVNAPHLLPDLHAAADSFVDGLGAPLPEEIARRIDSDGDELASIIDYGGQVFYCPPARSNTFDLQFNNGNPGMTQGADAATRRLIFAFRGDAQQNGLIGHPQTAAPYLQPQPSHGLPWELGVWSAAGLTPPPAVGPWDAAFAAKMNTQYGLTTTTLTTLGFTLPLSGLPDVAAWDATLSAGDRFAVACLALRDHAFASMWRATSSAVLINQARIDHEWMTRFLMWAKLNRPDDCRIPRIPWHALMTDLPLLQYDCFAPPQASSAYPARTSNPTWKIYNVLSERPLIYARSWSTNNTPTASSGTGRFNLTAPFTAAERCRQLIVWSVDWQSYEDFEEAPSAAYDSGRLSWRPKSATQADEQRNPYDTKPPAEWLLVFNAARTGTLVSQSLYNVDAFHGSSSNPTVPSPMEYFGRYGADRNGNQVFDRGTTKKSVRMKAKTIARFNLYDPRGHVVLR